LVVTTRYVHAYLNTRQLPLLKGDGRPCRKQLSKCSGEPARVWRRRALPAVLVLGQTDDNRLDRLLSRQLGESPYRPLLLVRPDGAGRGQLFFRIAEGDPDPLRSVIDGHPAHRGRMPHLKPSRSAAAGQRDGSAGRKDAGSPGPAFPAGLRSPGLASGRGVFEQEGQVRSVGELQWRASPP